VPSGHLFLSRVPDAPAAALAEELAAMGLYDVNPEAIRRLQKPLSGVLLERNGSNLASAIQGLEDIEPECLARVRDYLAAITEYVQGFHAVRYGEYETVRFLMRSKSAETPMELDAASMSNGTLRALAALVAAFQVYEPTGHPSVVGIEEPETSLHPGASGALVDAVQEATGRTQILLTTHSADLLGDRDVKPFHVLVVRMRDGQTQIAPVDAASREIIRKELYTLADLQRMNQLEPDEADLERQANSKSVDEER
jgi:predicted ATPase